MENNRRSFFKGLAVFASGVVAAKVTSYVPKKKEELLVSSTITIHHNGEQYHPLIVKKTEDDGHILISTNTDSGHSIGGIRFKDKTEPKIRKANI